MTKHVRNKETGVIHEVEESYAAYLLSCEAEIFEEVPKEPVVEKKPAPKNKKRVI